MRGLATLDTKTPCKAIQCSILAKFKDKQGVSIFKIYIDNTDRAPILPTYKTFLSSWSSLTGN